MKISFNMFKKDKVVEAAPEVVSSGKHLWLHISPEGWSTIWKSEGVAAQTGESWEALTVPETGLKRLELIFRNSVDTLGTSLAQAAAVNILLDDPDFVYSDNHAQQLSLKNPSVVRKYGQQLLAQKEVSCVSGLFPAIQEDRGEQPFYGFANADRLRQLLTLFDTSGMKIKTVIPYDLMVLQHGVNSGQKVYAALRVGVQESTIILVNTVLGALLVRKIGVGVVNIAMAVAEKGAITMDEALQALSRKNLLDGIQLPTSEGTGTSSMRSNPHQQAMTPLLQQLAEEVRESIIFFAEQRAAGKPESIELFGEVEKINGLNSWLEKNIGVQLNKSKQNFLTLFSTQDRPKENNLLLGTESTLLTVGKKNLTFTEQEGFVPRKEAPRPIAVSAPKHGGRSRNRVEKGKPAASMGSIVARIQALMQKKDSKPETDADAEPSVNAQDRQYFALFGVFIISLLYYGYDLYSTMSTSYLRAASTYIDLRKKNDDLGNVASAANKMESEAVANKILWAEKILIIADHMNENIWLTDMYLEKDGNTKDPGSEKSKLHFSGGVLPSTDGHVIKIAEYLGKLLKDETRFMIDFSKITFGGVELTGADSDPVVQFSFTAWYDQNKRQSAKPAPREDKPAGLPEMHKAIEENRRAAEEAAKLR